MTISDATNDRSKTMEHTRPVGPKPSISIELKSQRAEWAERWFAGSASCPVCGGDEMNVVRTRGEGTYLMETWRCSTRGCPGRWQIEWRESAAGIDDGTDDLEAQWYERESEPLKFQIVVEDGNVTGVRAVAGCNIPDPCPRFTVRRYETRGFDAYEISGIDEAGRAYLEHDVSMTPSQSGGDQNICALLVASTAHITAEEAQSLTDHGYARGEYGFFCYVASSNAVLSELGGLSEGLRGIIEEARRRGCTYVLLDRDGPTVSGIAIYSW
jgi:hypothetical protein